MCFFYDLLIVFTCTLTCSKFILTMIYGLQFVYYTNLVRVGDSERTFEIISYHDVYR